MGLTNDLHLARVLFIERVFRVGQNHRPHDTLRNSVTALARFQGRRGGGELARGGGSFEGGGRGLLGYGPALEPVSQPRKVTHGPPLALDLARLLVAGHQNGCTRLTM